MKLKIFITTSIWFLSSVFLWAQEFNEDIARVKSVETQYQLAFSERSSKASTVYFSEFNEQGNVITKKRTELEDNYEVITNYKYDINDKIVSEVEFWDKKKSYEQKYKRNDKGELVEFIFNQDNFNMKKRYWYKDGLLTKETVFVSDTIDRIFHYSYKDGKDLLRWYCKKNGETESERIYYYNEFNKLNKTVYKNYLDDVKEIKTFDSFGEIIQILGEDLKGSFKYIKEYSDGLVIKHERKFDGRGLRQTEDLHGKLISTEYEYDSFKNVTQKKIFHNNIHEATYYNEYKYDDKGNWIYFKEIQNNLYKVQRRKFIYW